MTEASPSSAGVPQGALSPLMHWVGRVIPAEPAADLFHAAFITAAAWTKEARHLSDVEFRFNRRYQLWNVPEDDERMNAQTDRLIKRRDAAREFAEEAEHILNRLWDDAGNRLRIAVPRQGFFVIGEFLAHRWPAGRLVAHRFYHGGETRAWWPE
jgi:hypothetical protein